MTRTEILAQSYTRVPFTRGDLHDVLRLMGPEVLISRSGRRLGRGVNRGHTDRMRASWTHENPTRNCCYFVTEMVFWYCAPPGSRPMEIKVDGDEGVHRFVLWPDDVIVDVTCDQYPETTLIAYDRARGARFLPAHTRSSDGGYMRGVSGPSKRARTLADMLDLHDIIEKTPTRPSRANSDSPSLF